MIGLDYNDRVKKEMQTLPVSYYCVNKNHPSYTTPLHWHRSVEIIRVLRGKLMINTTEKTIFAENDMITIINQDIVHGFNPCADDEDCIYEIIDFDLYEIMFRTTLCMEILHKLSSKQTNFNSFSKTNYKAFLEADKLFKAISQIENSNGLMILGAIFEFLGFMYNEQLYCKSAEESKLALSFKPVLSYIEENYSHEIKLEQLSGILNISTSYFSSKFTDTFKQSPIQYLNSYRLEKACRLLIDTQRSITDIAFSCGFNDSSYFVKKFYKYKNVTPKQFRSIATHLD